MPNLMEIPYFIPMVVFAAILLAAIKFVWCVLKKKRETKKPHITFRDLDDGTRVAVLHTEVIPKLDDLDKLFNQALDRLAIDGDVSDEDYSLALESYRAFKKERHAV